jgi:ATP phosphoribosyltransferase
MLQIALPNKGTLSEEAILLVREAGYRCKTTGRELAIVDTENDVEFFFLRPRDIAIYVSTGVLDVGITGRDLALDSRSGAVELLSLQFGRSSFYYAVPKESSLTPDTLSGLRVATAYEHLVADDLKRRGVNASVVRLDGAVEISIRLGVADAIADVVESGRTLTEAGLKTVGEPILKSEAVVIARNESIYKKDGVKTFIERLKGIVVAREYVMVEYDCPTRILQQACAITPGIESPTVSPLSEDGWVAVKSMSKRKDINRIIDALAGAGAKGIIVTEIKTCRI